MKFRVRVDDQWYQAEVGDLSARPVEVWIDGERFEVWPEADGLASPASGTPAQVSKDRVPQPPTGTGQAATSAEPRSPAGQSIENRAVAAGNGSLQEVRAPIPGVIVSLAVDPQSQVEPGDELCVLEAMKMNNVIRAARSGTIMAIHVSPGQLVAHRELLMEYSN